ncbi:TPM domain-containing protein [Microbacterium sp. ARD32]|uniref:TPM domain-containing protein n=1 Tax=Microbacterium sp. ARD32 TaxID=2962577 RepID=UPI002880DFBC|nr:TPM domain-containing protein [Microbacterium sp. ARD32]MDT0156456.1 TPM domain-containing protein [Microbacterium sp. ARD32]
MRGPWKTITALTSTIALAAGLVLAGAGAASADTPADLDPGFVTDASGVLDDAAQARLEQQLSELAGKPDRPELYVILVPDFEDPDNALAWADATALRNNLAPDQYLLAIATEGRSLAISAEYGGDGVAAGPLSESRVLSIEDHLGGEYLADDDWSGGISYVAGEFDKVPWPWWVWVLGVAVLALIVFAVVRLVVYLRRRAALAAELRTLEGQKKRAARLLVRADEAVKTSEQELGFVTAEYGEETTAEFTSVLEECRARLDHGFQLLQKLEDAIEDTPAQTRAWTDEIIALCAQIDRDLDARTQRLASLRALAQGSAKTLARLQTARDEAAHLQQDAAQRLDALRAAFPPAALVGVTGNADEIGDRLRDADAQLAALEKAVKAHRAKAISDAVHEIERLLAEATALRDAVKAQADALAAGAAGSGAAGADAAQKSTLELARAAVHAADLSAQARPADVNALALTRLNLAKRQLAQAEASADPARVELLASSALSVAEQVQSLTSAPTAPISGRFTRSSASATGSAQHIVHHTAPSRPSWSAQSAASSRDDDGRGGKAVLGALGGAVLGFFSSLSIADGNGGAIVLFIILGAVFGALSGAFGGQGGGSSSGWGGSSSRRSSWHSSSRSSRSHSSRSFSSRSSGSRSSGRSGGRRF